MLTAEGNVGRRAAPAASDPGIPEVPPATCRRSRGRFAESPAYECFWEPGHRFGGWQQSPRRPRTTGYEKVLRAAGF